MGITHVYLVSHKRIFLTYYFDDHEDLEGKIQVLTNLGLVREITYNNVRRFVFEEELVDYLSG